MGRALFGTDGLRGRANRYPMTPEVCLVLGRAVVRHFSMSLSEPRQDRQVLVTIGRDTRHSGPMFESALAAGIMSMGADVGLLGVIPTPGVAQVTRMVGANAGLVISASHNPYWDNGIKIFGPDGFKLEDRVEAEIERLMEELEEEVRPVAQTDRIGRPSVLTNAIERYGAFLKATVPPDLRLSGLRVVLDCAHGAAYQVGGQVLSALDASVVVTGDAPDGLNINQGCGALHTDHAASLVLAHHADLGIALDGDADRVLLIDEQGGGVDGDDILAMIALGWKSRGHLTANTVVATIMSNLGLQLALEEQGIALVRTGVGDRYVVEEMRRIGSNLGGESSGHILCLDRATTGDGLVAALLIATEMVQSGQPLSKLRKVMRHFPQTTVEVPVNQKTPLEQLDGVNTAIRSAQRALEATGRVVVRYSGTELVARVMVEGEDPDEVDRWAHEIAIALTEAVGRQSP